MKQSIYSKSRTQRLPTWPSWYHGWYVATASMFKLLAILLTIIRVPTRGMTVSASPLNSHINAMSQSVYVIAYNYCSATDGRCKESFQTLHHCNSANWSRSIASRCPMFIIIYSSVRTNDLVRQCYIHRYDTHPGKSCLVNDGTWEPPL